MKLVIVAKEADRERILKKGIDLNSGPRLASQAYAQWNHTMDV